LELEEWIRGIEKIFTTLEFPEDKKVNIGIFYLTKEVRFWWKAIKERLLGLDSTSRFLEELKMSGSLTVMQYASKFTELSKFISEFVSSERLKMRRFEEGLAFYIHDQLAGQLILTYKELYERVAEVEQMKTELRALKPINQTKKWTE